MKSLDMKTDYSLELSLNDLHRQSLAWLSEIDLWSIEIPFFKKLLRRAATNFVNFQDKEELDHFEELSDYYNNRLFRELKSKISDHNSKLLDLLKADKTQDEEKFRETHRELEKILLTFEQEFKNFKKEFLTFIEKNLD